MTDQEATSACQMAACPNHRREPEPCRYFALCDNTATHHRPHPAFPDGVPTCDRCGAKVDRIEAGE